MAEAVACEIGYWNAALPPRCVIPIQMHTGAPAHPTVVIGDRVEEGTVIGATDEADPFPVHASVPGIVSGIGMTTLVDGSRSTAIQIDLDGAFTNLARTPVSHGWSELRPDELRQLIRAGGVVAGVRSNVPLDRYLVEGRDAPVSHLVIDIADVEPYQTADAEVAASEAAAVVEGASIAAGCFEQPPAIVVVVARGYRRALRALRRARTDANVRIVAVPHFYPGNSPAALAHAVGAESADVLRVIDAQAARAVRDAVVFRTPQIDRVVAVGGGVIRRPAHVRVRIGTPFAEVFTECDGLVSEPARIVSGGVLTGSAVTSIATPVTKSTRSILALRRQELRLGAEEPCIGCGACVRACPVAIDPAAINAMLLRGTLQSAREAGLDTCVECGLCSHVCPSRIPLVRRFSEAKAGHRPLARDRDDA